MSLHQRCLINKTEDLYPLKGYENHGLVKSKSSKLVFMHRIPSAEELSEYYNQYSRNVPESTITTKRYNELLDQFEAYREHNNILDVGCGDGHFLVEAQKRGWQVYGTEFTKESADIARKKGIHMRQGSLNAKNFKNIQFDVITSFEVIEHINNPLEEMKEVSSLLKKGGLFYVTTPNFNALERRFLGERYPIIAYPEHLIYFTPKTISRLMSKVGLSKKNILTTGLKLSSFKKEESRNSEKRIGGVKVSDENLRQNIEKSNLLLFTKNVINKLLTLFQLGNAMKCYFIKK